MKILLVYPEIEQKEKGLSAFIQKFFNKQKEIPLALIESAIHLPITWEERLVDMNQSKLKNEDIRWADYVVIKAGIKQLSSTQELIIRLKSFGKKIVAEGELFNAQPNNFDEVDYLVLNKATLTPFVNDLEFGEPKKVYSTLQVKQKPPKGPFSLLGFSAYFSKNIHPFSA